MTAPCSSVSSFWSCTLIDVIYPLELRRLGQDKGSQVSQDSIALVRYLDPSCSLELTRIVPLTDDPCLCGKGIHLARLHLENKCSIRWHEAPANFGFLPARLLCSTGFEGERAVFTAHSSKPVAPQGGASVWQRLVLNRLCGARINTEFVHNTSRSWCLDTMKKPVTLRKDTLELGLCYRIHLLILRLEWCTYNNIIYEYVYHAMMRGIDVFQSSRATKVVD